MRLAIFDIIDFAGWPLPVTIRIDGPDVIVETCDTEVIQS
jgi:hypothetical protein